MKNSFQSIKRWLSSKSTSVSIIDSTPTRYPEFLHHTYPLTYLSVKLLTYCLNSQFAQILSFT